MKFSAPKKPRFSVKLAPSPGTYADDPRWSNADIDPAPVALRIWGTGSFAAYWVSDMLAPPLWSTISTAMSIGFTAREVIPITFAGFFLCGIVVSLTGRIAATYHVPFPVIARASFGMWGCIPMIFLRSTVALLWTAISVVQAGGFLENMISAIWPKFSSWNHLPESANITSAGILTVVLYWFIQTYVSMLPIKKLRYFFIFKTILVTPTWFALFLWAVIVTHGGGPLVLGPTDINPKVGRVWSALQALNVVIGLFSSLAVNMPDFARFSRSHKASASQALLLPAIGTLGALSPIFITSAYKQIWGRYEWFLPAVIASFHSRPIKFFTGFAMMIATLGNQIAAGSFPFGNDISGIFPQYVNIRRAAVLMSIFCLISCPWDIIANAAALLSFLSGYSCFMGPLAGVMCSDYYLVRKGKFNIGELYNPNGLYRYNRGWNWRAFVAFFIPVSVLIPGLAYSISPTTVKVNDGILHLYAFSWLFGITMAASIYYVICTYISPPTSSFSEVAVYPPQTIEEEEARVRERAGKDLDGGKVTPTDEKEAPIDVKEASDFV
jgi:NCS1 family nucleobase:cation symporter-1